MKFRILSRSVVFTGLTTNSDSSELGIEDEIFLIYQHPSHKSRIFMYVRIECLVCNLVLGSWLFFNPYWIVFQLRFCFAGYREVARISRRGIPSSFEDDARKINHMCERLGTPPVAGLCFKVCLVKILQVQDIHYNMFIWQVCLGFLKFSFQHHVNHPSWVPSSNLMIKSELRL